jgi:hypothetical protein|tara:strand:+ start:531 stop:869 length:339 start_codon:yes stop_codon:yes gene_type:complete
MATDRQLIEAVLLANQRIEQLIGMAFGPLGSAAVRFQQSPLGGKGLMDFESLIETGPTVGRKVQKKVRASRKVSAYQLEFGRQLKKLKKKHPRTKISRLMKRAHTATKKVRR